MNQKIYDAEKAAAGSLRRVYWAFEDDKYGAWQKSLTGTANYAVIERCSLKSRYFYGGGTVPNLSGTATATRTIPRLKAAKSVDFTVKVYRTSTNVLNWTGWNAYFSVYNDFIKFNYYKNDFKFCLNGQEIISLAENTVHYVRIHQTFTTVNNILFGHGGINIFDTGVDMIAAYCHMGMVATTPGLLCNAGLYIEVSDTVVTW